MQNQKNKTRVSRNQVHRTTGTFCKGFHSYGLNQRQGGGIMDDQCGVVERGAQPLESPWRKMNSFFSRMGGIFKVSADLGQGVVNGIAGDYLSAKNNGLAQKMAFYHKGKPLSLSWRGVRAAYPGAGEKVVVMVHGLCCTEVLFGFPNEPGTDYGTLLEKDLGYTPIYLRYNTGLHISENGREFNRLMEELFSVWPGKISEIVLIGHSMGGLIIRSACHYGIEKGSAWTRAVSRVFYLGSPHLGAPLEKVGNIFTCFLKAVPTAYTWVAADLINLRSAAIKDLRFGYVIDDEWKGRDPDEFLKNRRKPVELLPHARHYTVAGTLNRDLDHPVTKAIGDILVRIPSAVPPASGVKNAPVFEAENQVVFPGLHHFALAAHPKVYEQIKTWCLEESNPK